MPLPGQSFLQNEPSWRFRSSCPRDTFIRPGVFRDRSCLCDNMCFGEALCGPDDVSCFQIGALLSLLLGRHTTIITRPNPLPPLPLPPIKQNTHHSTTTLSYARPPHKKSPPPADTTIPFITLYLCIAPTCSALFITYPVGLPPAPPPARQDTPQTLFPALPRASAAEREPIACTRVRSSS